MATQTLSGLAPTEQYSFVAKAIGPMAEFARLTLYDGHMRVMADNYQSIDCRLPKGLYKLTLKLNEAYTEQFVALENNYQENIPTPQTASAVISEGFNTMHGYYDRPARAISQQPTAELEACAGNGALFFFFRYPDRRTFDTCHLPGMRLTDNFKLLNADRKIICDFAANQVWEESDYFGYSGFHASLAPGVYYLYYEGNSPAGRLHKQWEEAPREMPVYIFEGWQTQGFMTFRKGPVFTSLIFSLSRLDQAERLGSQVQSELNVLEGVLRKFANGIYYLPEHVLADLAHRKFENPVLGLIAAYSYFKSNGREQEVFFDTVVTNLNEVLGSQCPDIIALNAMAAVHFANASYSTDGAVNTPAMFAPGFSLLLRQQQDHVRVMPKSIAEKCIEKLFHDLVWTSYKPLGRPKEVSSIAARESDPIERKGRKLTSEIFSTAETANVSVYKANMIAGDMADRPKKPPVLNSWIANSLMYVLQNNGEEKQISLNELAVQLQVTPGVLLTTAKRLTRYQDKILTYLHTQNDPVLPEIFSNENLRKVAALIQSGSVR